MPSKFDIDSLCAMEIWMQDSFCSYEWGTWSLPQIKIGFIISDYKYNKQKISPAQISFLTQNIWHIFWN